MTQTYTWTKYLYVYTYIKRPLYGFSICRMEEGILITMDTDGCVAFNSRAEKNGVGLRVF